MKETDYGNLQEKYQKELNRGYLARRKGGIAWKQHCATFKNLERKMELTLKKAINEYVDRLHAETEER